MFDGVSLTAALSNTVCVQDLLGSWRTVNKGVVQDFSAFGEVARLDTSLVSSVLVTYFDVRSAQKLLLQRASAAEPLPQAAQDFRSVQVSMTSFVKKFGTRTNFEQFGEVAHIAVLGVDACIEFYDMRAAQALILAAPESTSPWLPQQQLPAFQLPGMLTAAAVSGLSLTPLARAALAAEEEPIAGSMDSEDKSPGAGTGKRPARTKIGNKEFSKYDINPEKILSGEDARTTVMVRNLLGHNARNGFMQYLEKCGLQDRHTFFYMPCKEHRNIPVGFAFVNFMSPHDVHKLYTMMKSDQWSELIRDSQSKAPAVSYARFQGHEELTKHFSSSAVLSRRNPEKRPSFRNVAAADQPELAEAKDASASNLHKPPGLESMGQPGGLQDAQLQAALAKGVEKIKELLIHEKMDKLQTPAYVRTSNPLQNAKDARRGARSAKPKLQGIAESSDSDEVQVSSAAQGA
jgi:hypothetical protein